jgi:DNA-binding transcriptional regulator YiaG
MHMATIAIFTADEICELRRRLGLSPTAFAARLKVSASAVSRWEKGERVPKVEPLIEMTKMAIEVGMISDELVGA